MIGSSRLGFLALDWRTGQVAWRRGAGAHLAPPLAHEDGVLLIGECEGAPLPPTGQIVVGCWRVVSADGADLGLGTLTGLATLVREFVDERGPARLVRLDDGRYAWHRGERAVALDLDTGVAAPFEPLPPTTLVTHRERSTRLLLGEDGALVALDAGGGRELWRTQTTFDALVTVVLNPGPEVPMARLVKLDGVSGRGVIDVLDVEITGTRQGQAGETVPGIQVLGHAARAPGAIALAVRLDATLQHDYVSAHDVRGRVAWVSPLPERPDRPRVDPVGLAITGDAVIAFHDGDRVTVFPPVEVSRNPTP